MNSEIRKDLASNWFRTLQDSFCDDICNLEKKKLTSNQRLGKETIKKMRVVVNIEFYKMEKFLKRLGSTFQGCTEGFQNNFKKIYPGQKEIQNFGLLEYR